MSSLQFPLAPDHAARLLAALVLRRLDGGGAQPGHPFYGNQYDSGGGAGDSKTEEKSSDRPKVRNERSQRALKAFVPADAKAQQHAEANELEVRSIIGGTRTDDNLPVDVVTNVGGKVKGVEVKTIINGRNNKITMRKAAIEKKVKWARSNRGTVHTVVLDDRGRLGNKGYSGHRVYYRKGTGSFRLGAMTKVKDSSHLRQLMGHR